jgi:hypothetical protein
MIIWLKTIGAVLIKLQEGVISSRVMPLPGRIVCRTKSFYLRAACRRAQEKAIVATEGSS